MRKGSNKRKLHMDNHGSGLVMVLIMVAFLGLLTGILMFVTYGGYKMRLVDKQSKDNFYTAETVLDEINIGLQTEVSDALTKAYQNVMVNYSLYETSVERTQKLYQIFYSELQLALQQDSMNPTRYNIEKLRGYLSEELYGDGEYADGSSANFGTYGAIVESNIQPESYTLSLQPDGIILKDLKVTYVNTSGYVSIISTDIRIILPSVDFSQSSAVPDLNKYCIIADGGLIAGNSMAGGSVVIEGDLYAESMTFGHATGQDYSGGNYTFVEGGEIIFKAPSAESGALEETNSLVVSKNAVQVNSATLKTDSVDFWGQSILLDSATADLHGNTYVKNDMKLEGNGSSATLYGTYTGFGTATDMADGSSAIVINGRNSSVDLSALESLNVSGHTFVATSIENPENIEGADNGQTDVMMGESVAVKSNQLIYLVPAEAIGCEILEGGLIGDSVYRSNPMKLEYYQEIIDNPDKYKLIDTSRRISSIGGHSLSEYMNAQELSGGDTGYRPIVIVKNSLVYFYMRFKDENAANLYFRHYYGANAQKVEKYTRIYADTIKMPANSTDLVYLHLAGNILTYDEDRFAVMEATDSVSAKKHAEELSLVRGDMFSALTSKMVTNIAQLSVQEQGRTVFNNIIDEQALRDMVDALKVSATDDTIVLSTTEGEEMSVVLSTGNYTVDGTKPDEDKVRLIVCLGDVRVKKDFGGVIIAGGKVIIGDERDVDHQVKLSSLSVEKFTELLSVNKTKDDTEYFVLDAFREGKNFTTSFMVKANSRTHEVSLDELIVYERWSKK